MFFMVHSSSWLIAITPLYFVRSGNVNIELGHLMSASYTGYIWSLAASSRHHDGIIIPSAYRLAFTTTSVNPSYGPYLRWHAFPLR